MINNIVIFGADNTGKSELTKQLVEYINTEIGLICESVHSPGPVGKEKMKKFIIDNLSEPGTNKVKIFDRLPVIEENIYGNLLRGHSDFDGEEEFVKKVFNSVDLFIFCYPGLFTILNWGDREQYPGVKENALELINMYNKMAVDLKRAGYNVKEYNFRKDDYRDLL